MADQLLTLLVISAQVHTVSANVAKWVSLPRVVREDDACVNLVSVQFLDIWELDVMRCFDQRQRQLADVTRVAANRYFSAVEVGFERAITEQVFTQTFLYQCRHNLSLQQVDSLW